MNLTFQGIILAAKNGGEAAMYFSFPLQMEALSCPNSMISISCRFFGVTKGSFWDDLRVEISPRRSSRRVTTSFVGDDAFYPIFVSQKTYFLVDKIDHPRLRASNCALLIGNTLYI